MNQKSRIPLVNRGRKRARHIHRGTNIMCHPCFNENIQILSEGPHRLPSPPVMVHASFLSLGVSLTCVVIAWEKGDEFDNEYPLVRILRNCMWKDCKVPENDENHHVLLQKCIGVDGKGCSTFQYVHPPCYVTGWNQEWSGVGPQDTEDGHLYCHTCSAGSDVRDWHLLLLFPVSETLVLPVMLRFH